MTETILAFIPLLLRGFLIDLWIACRECEKRKSKAGRQA